MSHDFNLHPFIQFVVYLVAKKYFRCYKAFNVFLKTNMNKYQKHTNLGKGHANFSFKSFPRHNHLEGKLRERLKNKICMFRRSILLIEMFLPMIVREQF